MVARLAMPDRRSALRSFGAPLPGVDICLYNKHIGTYFQRFKSTLVATVMRLAVMPVFYKGIKEFMALLYDGRGEEQANGRECAIRPG